MLKPHVPYEAAKAEEYAAKQRERELARLKRQAAHLGDSLTPHPTATESPVA